MRNPRGNCCQHGRSADQSRHMAMRPSGDPADARQAGFSNGILIFEGHLMIEITHYHMVRFGKLEGRQNIPRRDRFRDRQYRQTDPQTGNRAGGIPTSSDCPASTRSTSPFASRRGDLSDRGKTSKRRFGKTSRRSRVASFRQVRTA